MLPKPLSFLEGHLGKVSGIFVGLLFGWFAISYGFWRTLFVALVVVAGYYIGKQIDENTDWDAFWDRIFRK